MFKKPMKTQWILTVLIFTKIHLEESHFIFVTRLRREGPGRETCSTSAVILMIFFWPLHLRLCIHRAVRAARLRKTIL